ncbi:MAG: carbonic anhydrase [Planctomycetota bacterium]|jgi:carbonic anhydrase
MGMEGYAAQRTARRWPLACMVMLTSALVSQHAPTTQPPRSQAASGAPHQQPRTPQSPAKPHKNSGATAPTHASKTHLPPLAAWQFVKNGNAAFVRSHRRTADHTRKNAGATNVTKTHHGASSAAGKHVVSEAIRPAGANKYVCAVIACADANCDIPALLGLARKDVLVLRLAGPFINAEAVALLDRTIKKHSTSLILVLSHHKCESLRIRTKGGDDALDRRLAAVRNAARSQRRTLYQAIGPQQRELLLASSSTMYDLVKRDRLRVIPGVINTATGAIEWLNRRAQALPLSPVK